MKYTCKQCGKEFTLTDSEISFYESKKLSLPKRCEECRKKNKQEQESEETQSKSERTKSQKSNTLLKSIITLIITLVLGTTAWNGVQENVSNDNNPNNNQTISTESNNSSENDETDTGNTSNSIQSNTSEHSNSNDDQITSEDSTLTFRNQKLLDSHYEKHGKEMGFSSAEEYEKAAARVVANKDALHKTEAEDGDDVYYIESTNEFVIVSQDGYLRTYFYPSDGLDYYNRQ